MEPPRLSSANASFPLFLLLLCMALYGPALHVFFSLDDINFLLRASGMEGDSLRLSRVISTQLFFRAAWVLFGVRSWLYHFVVLVIHAVSAWVIYLITLRLGHKRFAAYASATLFLAAPVAFHPLHWISGIQEVSAAFFALLAVYYFLGEGNGTLVISLVASVFSVLCKETAFLLLPVFALIMPGMPKRRRMAGVGALLLGAVVLVAAGKLTPRPAGDPYETVFGMNVVWNLLTYSAWLVRLWDFFPDHVPQYDTNMAAWGLLLPALICIAIGCIAKLRRSLVSATILFLVLLAPVLPLIRHSYFYYLYMPLIPFWLFIGGMLARIQKKTVAVGILVAFISYSFVFGLQHRRVEIADGVLKDSILRYAGVAESAVKTFGATGEVKPGDYLFVIHRSAESIDLTIKRDGIAPDRLKRSTLFERALLGGRGLRLFFPEIRNVHVEYAADATPGWEDMHIYWLSNVGMGYMGYGMEGRMNIAGSSLKRGGYDRAQREVDIMLKLQPNNPRLIFYLGTIALQRGNESKLDSLLSILQIMAEEEERPGLATEAFRVLNNAAAER